MNILNIKKKKKKIFSDDEESDKADGEGEQANGAHEQQGAEKEEYANVKEHAQCDGGGDTAEVAPDVAAYVAAEGESKQHTVPEGTSEKENSEENDEAVREENDEAVREESDEAVRGEGDEANGGDVPPEGEEQEQHPSGNNDENGINKKKKKLRRLKKCTDESDTQEGTQEAGEQKVARKISKKNFIVKGGAHQRGGEDVDEDGDGKSPPDDRHEASRREEKKKKKKKKEKGKAKGDKKNEAKYDGDTNLNEGANSDASYRDGDDQGGSEEEEDDDDDDEYGGFHSDDHSGSEPEEEDELSQGESDEEEKKKKSRRKKKAGGGTQKKSDPKGNESKGDKDGDGTAQVKEKKKKTKNSKLMEDINPDEDKLKLKLICMSFHKKEYTIEEFILESLKVIIPQYKREVFLNQENLIIDSTSREDLKNLEVFWFDRLTRNRRRSIISCFTTLGKLGLGGNATNGAGAPENVMRTSENMTSAPENVTSAPENVASAPENGGAASQNGGAASQNGGTASQNGGAASQNGGDAPENAASAGNAPLEQIFTKKKDQIIVDHLAALCTQQVKLVKEYISYVRKNIFDLSSISENNEKIKELNILDPLKRRELFFYLNLCISMNYIQEQAPNVYALPNDLSPDIRGFNLHPMFSHINKKKNEQRREKAGNPWEKLKLLKKSQKTDAANKSSETSMRKGDVPAQVSTKKNETNEEEAEVDENEEKKKNNKHTDDTEMVNKKTLEDEEKKKKALEEMKKKKKEKDEKKTYNVYSLLESAAQYFGEGPKYSNPNMHEFYKSNNNQLVYIKPPGNIDEKNILINYFLQFPSITKKLEYNKRRIYAENYGLVRIIKNSENLPVSFSLNTHPWLLEPYEELWKEQNKLNNFGIFNMANLLRDDDDDLLSFESNQFSFTRGEAQKVQAVKMEGVKMEAVKMEAVKGEAEKMEGVKMEGVKMEGVKTEARKTDTSKVDTAETAASKTAAPQKGDAKCDAPQPEGPPPRTPNEPGEQTAALPTEVKVIDSKRKSDFLTKKIKKFCSNEDSKQLKLTSFLSREKVSKNVDAVKKGESEQPGKDKPTPGESSKGVGGNQKEEQPGEEPPQDNEKEDAEYIKIKKKKKRVLDDEAINEIHDSQADKDTNKGSHVDQINGRDGKPSGSTASNNPEWVKDYDVAQNGHGEQPEGSVRIKKKLKRKLVQGENDIGYDADDGGEDDGGEDDGHDDDGHDDNGNDDNGNDDNAHDDDDAKGSENPNEDERNNEQADKRNNHLYAALKERFAKEKKRLRDDKMQHVFELEAEESDDENIEDPEERKKAQLLKGKKNQAEESDDDEQYNSEGLNEFINNEEYNSDNEVVKLKHKQEMEQLEEDIFLKKFTYQGKEFNHELTNREKLELERERQLLRRKKLLFDKTLGHVKLSDFESDSSTSSNNSSKKRIKNTLYEPFTELENAKLSKRNHHAVGGGAYNEGAFKKGEYHADMEGEHRRKQIQEKMDNVMYTKEIKTNEGKRIVIKKKRKIRFHQDLSDVTVTEEEQVDAYEKTKKKPKKVNANLVEQPKSSAVTIPNKGMNHNNKASIKWNSNIKDISELDTPTNSEVFKGFRKVENAQ